MGGLLAEGNWMTHWSFGGFEVGVGVVWSGGVSWDTPCELGRGRSFEIT